MENVGGKRQRYLKTTPQITLLLAVEGTIVCVMCCFGCSHCVGIQCILNCGVPGQVFRQGACLAPVDSRKDRGLWIEACCQDPQLGRGISPTGEGHSGPW